MRKKIEELPEFGKLVRKKRIALDLTQKEISEKMGVSKNYISQLENGTTNAGINAIEKISKILEIDIKELIEIRKK